MCQCFLFDCFWVNCCGQFCAGWHLSYCFCSIWLCKPDDLQSYDPEKCHILAFDGFGQNCFCCGSICFASQPLKEWSIMRRRTSASEQSNVVINQTEQQVERGQRS